MRHDPLANAAPCDRQKEKPNLVMMTVGPEPPSQPPHQASSHPHTLVVLGPVEPKGIGSKGLATKEFTGMKQDGDPSVSMDLRWDKQGYQR